MRITSSVEQSDDASSQNELGLMRIFDETRLWKFGKPDQRCFDNYVTYLTQKRP